LATTKNIGYNYNQQTIFLRLFVKKISTLYERQKFVKKMLRKLELNIHRYFYNVWFL